MSTDQEPQPMFWNAGAWWGSQLGSTCWILVAGVLSLFKDRTVGLEVLAVFGIATGLGSALWLARERIAAYRASQLLILIAGVSGVITVWLLEHASVYESIQSGGTVSAAGTYRILIAVTVGLLLLMCFRFGRQPRSR